MSKTKVLFVVYDFFQAGAERFAYEIDQALDKKKYETSILCLQIEKHKDDTWKEPYYFQKHKNLGTKIFFFDKFLPSKILVNRGVRVIKRKLYNTPTCDYNSKLVPFFNHYDLIHWIGEYTYLHNLPQKIVSKSLISSMSARFQNPKLYAKFDFNLKYNFADAFSQEERVFEYAEFRDTIHWHIPLLFKISSKTNGWKFANNGIKKIGIFTRLDRYKPLDPFFYAFHLLLNEVADCELHIFGNGDPEKEGMSRYISNLGIRSKVFFRGHQENIVETAKREHIDLSWFQGYNNNRPAGYAGFDICSTGTPLICWDFLEMPSNPFNEIYPHYKNLLQFVDKSKVILTNEDEANSLSFKQFRDVLENRDIDKNFHLIENAYRSILQNK